MHALRLLVKQHLRRVARSFTILSGSGWRLHEEHWPQVRLLRVSVRVALCRSYAATHSLPYGRETVCVRVLRILHDQCGQLETSRSNQTYETSLLAGLPTNSTNLVRLSLENIPLISGFFIVGFYYLVGFI
uniref:Uncharacterized protein n=1 Tax=Cacopsylla melanoneura TaxID=428564 RepID=A0A8D8QFG9_9HEMI